MGSLIWRSLNAVGEVVRRTETSRDALNAPVLTWAVSSAVAWPNGVPCDLQDLRGMEDRMAKQVAQATHKLFLPPGVDITEKDRFRVEGVDYPVVYVGSRPGGDEDHMECELQEVRT